jgi:CheY-like chemotaxis protein
VQLLLDICLVMDTLEVLVDSQAPHERAEAVLLVDDDDLFVRAVTRQLRALGYPYVFRASSAAEALDMLQRVRPTVVLTDMVMEHREAGRWVVAAADQLGVAVTVVSGMPGLDESTVGHRFCRKSDLDAAKLEQLVGDMVAENRACGRASSIFSDRMNADRISLNQFVARKTA